MITKGSQAPFSTRPRLALDAYLDGRTCAAFLQRAAVYFADHGIDRMHRLLTDDAWAYRHCLPQVSAQLGIEQKFTKPHCPWQNGKADRFNRTLATE